VVHLHWSVFTPWPAQWHEEWFYASATSIAFAIAAWVLRAVSTSGAVAGAVVAFIFYLDGGLQYFLTLLLVFLITWGATRAGRGRKVRLEGDREQSRRTAAQVMANLGVSSAALLGAVMFDSGIILFGISVAALAEAAADTVSSEIGKAFGRRTVLISTFTDCSAGTDGGISWTGTAGGAAAAILTALAAGTGRMNAAQIGFLAVAGFLGMLLDSMAGAIWERKGKLGNDAVNLIGTTAAALIAWALLESL
jgi:uncharacterized protein (TIGR00297 family)